MHKRGTIRRLSCCCVVAAVVVDAAKCPGGPVGRGGLVGAAGAELAPAAPVGSVEAAGLVALAAGRALSRQGAEAGSRVTIAVAVELALEQVCPVAAVLLSAV